MIASILSLLSGLRPYTRTNPPKARALLEQAASGLNDIIHSDLSDYFDDASDVPYVGFVTTLERLRDNLIVAQRNLATWPGTMEGYIDGCKIELEQLKAEMEEKP